MSKARGNLALDSNAIIAYRGNDPHAIAWIESCEALFIPVLVVGELEFGALHSAKPDENLKRLAMLLNLGTVLDVTRDTASRYAIIRQQLSIQGKPIPEADLWIASICLENSIPLLSADGHFEPVPGLIRYDWKNPVTK